MIVLSNSRLTLVCSCNNRQTTKVEVNFIKITKQEVLSEVGMNKVIQINALVSELNTDENRGNSIEI